METDDCHLFTLFVCKCICKVYSPPEILVLSRASGLDVYLPFKSVFQFPHVIVAQGMSGVGNKTDFTQQWEIMESHFIDKKDPLCEENKNTLSLF